MDSPAYIKHRVRKHRTPKGALRQFQPAGPDPYSGVVRKHRAPKGALIHVNFPPSLGVEVRKHRAPEGVFRPIVVDTADPLFLLT